jgi:hypothetical protein
VSIASYLGRQADYPIADFEEDIKCLCAREDIVFDNDILNELVG